jgi:hypothetical protein
MLSALSIVIHSQPLSLPTHTGSRWRHPPSRATSGSGRLGRGPRRKTLERHLTWTVATFQSRNARGEYGRYQRFGRPAAHRILRKKFNEYITEYAVQVEEDVPVLASRLSGPPAAPRAAECWPFAEHPVRKVVLLLMQPVCPQQFCGWQRQLFYSPQDSPAQSAQAEPKSPCPDPLSGVPSPEFA